METVPSANFMWIQLGLFGIALLCCALFSFLETVVTAMRLFQLKELAERTGKYRRLFEALEKNPHRILITILVANSLASTTAAALITDLMEDLFAKLHFSSGLGFTLGIAIATTAILIIGEIIPKNLAKARGEALFASTLWLTNAIFFLLYPFVTFLVHLSNYVVFKISGGTLSGSDAVASEKEIRFMIDYINEKGLMEPEKTRMLQSVFSMGQTPVNQIMVPATDITSVSADKTISETVEIFAQSHFSRLPLYQETRDNITGMIHQKDIFMLLLNKEDKPLTEIARPVLFIPETMKVNQLLREFKRQRMHMAMVVNEFGGIVGLVTLEDVLEELVGEISDEHEPVQEKIVPLKEGGWLVDAGIELSELRRTLKIKFSTSAVTLAGFLAEVLEHVPRKGERIEYGGYIFQVQKASPKRVYQVLVFKETETPPTS